MYFAKADAPPPLLQLKFASLDLELHTRYVPGGSESIYDVDRKISRRTQIIPPLPEDRFLCSFSHIFAGSIRVTHYSVWDLECRLAHITIYLIFFLWIDRWICGLIP